MGCGSDLCLRPATQQEAFCWGGPMMLPSELSASALIQSMLINIMLGSRQVFRIHPVALDRSLMTIRLSAKPF